MVGFTSGTTSLPKAYQRTRGSWSRSLARSVEYFGVTVQDAVFVPGSLAQSGNLYALAETLFAGATFHTVADADGSMALAQWQEHLDKYPITRIVAAPTALHYLSRASSSAGAAQGAEAASSAAANDLTVLNAAGRHSSPRISTVVSVGSKLEQSTVQRLESWFPEAKIFEYYGASELGFVAAHRRDQGPEKYLHADLEGTAVGRAFPGVEIAVIDQHGNRVPEWVPGTIVVRTDLQCSGYVLGEDAEGFYQIEVVHDDGGTSPTWYSVGDQGYLTPDGELHFLSRKSDMLVTAGDNVYPHEVELALCQADGVEIAVVTGIPDELRGTRLVAGIMAADRFSASSLTSRGLQSAVRDSLAQHKVPQLYYLLDELPLSLQGKVSRAELAAWISSGDSRLHRLA